MKVFHRCLVLKFVITFYTAKKSLRSEKTHYTSGGKQTTKECLTGLHKILGTYFQ